MSFWKKLTEAIGFAKKEYKENIKVVEEEVAVITKSETVEHQEEASKEEDAMVDVVLEEAEPLSEIDALKEELSDAFNKLTSMDEYWDAIVAIEAVAVSCASSDKDFSESERKEIRTFIEKITVDKEIPSSVQEKIDAIYQNPLPLNQAFVLAQDSKVEMSVFEDVIDSVMHVDGVKFEEKVVLNAWHDFKKQSA